MSLNGLISALEREAAQQADQIRAEAQAQADAVLAGLRAQAAEEQQRRVCEHTVRLRAEAQRELARVRRTARAGWLKARKQFLDRVFSAAALHFDAVIAQPEYQTRLVEQLEQAWPLVDQNAVIHCSAQLEAAVRNWAGARNGVQVDADEAAHHGFRIVTAAGATEISCLLEDAIERERTGLEIEVMRSCCPNATEP